MRVDNGFWKKKTTVVEDVLCVVSKFTGVGRPENITVCFFDEYEPGEYRRLRVEMSLAEATDLRNRLSRWVEGDPK